MLPEPSSARIPPSDDAARRAWLIHTLAGLAPDVTGKIGDETALTDGGLSLDSLALIDLIAILEVRLDVIVLEEEITGENFASVGRLLRFLEARLG